MEEESPPTSSMTPIDAISVEIDNTQEGISSVSNGTSSQSSNHPPASPERHQQIKDLAKTSMQKLRPNRDPETNSRTGSPERVSPQVPPKRSHTQGSIASQAAESEPANRSNPYRFTPNPQKNPSISDHRHGTALFDEPDNSQGTKHEGVDYGVVPVDEYYEASKVPKHGQNGTATRGSYQQRIAEKQNVENERKHTLDDKAGRAASPSKETAKFVDDILKSTQKECQRLKSRVASLERDLSDTQRELSSTQRDLSNAQDIIFRLQPPQPMIMPNDAAKEFSSLCGVIEDWVQTWLRDVIYLKSDWETQLKSSVFELDQLEDWMDLVSDRGRGAFQAPQSDEYNIIAGIMYYLCLHIFQTDFWCPPRSDFMKLVGEIETSMEKLKPRRDFAAMRTWHIETMKALAYRQGALPTQRTYAKDLAQKLHSLLLIFLPESQSSESLRSIKHDIIDPAIDLAQRLQLSVDRYDVKWSGFKKGHFDITRYECQNILGNGEALKFPAAQSRRNTYIMDVCPGLYHQELKADGYGELQVLKKPKILVASQDAKEPDFKFKAKHRGRAVTLLGCLDEKLMELRNPKKGGWLSGRT